MAFLSGHRHRWYIACEQLLYPDVIKLSGILGVALLTADSMLTSAVSVTSAIEGIGLAVPAFDGNVNPKNYRATNAISAVVICLIFVLQAAGSNKIGLAYAPVILCWMLFIAIVGIMNIALYPAIFSAFSPVK